MTRTTLRTDVRKVVNHERTRKHTAVESRIYPEPLDGTEETISLWKPTLNS